MTGQFVRRRELGCGERDRMHDLLARHFDGVDRATFEADLANKDWVVLLERAGELVGFTTLAAYDAEHPGGRISVVCSGDTIVAPEAWQSAALPRTWIAAVREIWRRDLRGERLYWLLLTSGIRTYRLLPVFWREFFPRHDRPAPPATVALLDTLARARFGDLYSSDTGLVCFGRPQILRGHLREVAPGRLNDPHVAYFLRRNPGWTSGDELVCLTEISPDNLTPAGRRIWTADAIRRVPMERAV